MLLIAGTVRIPVENVEGTRLAAQAMIDETLKEDGCLSYAFAQDLLDPGLIHVAETWSDGAALKAHAESAHMATWREATGRLGFHDRNLKLYRTEEGKPI